jgi:hypothetical protein
MCGVRMNSSSPLSANAFDGTSHHWTSASSSAQKFQEMPFEIGNSDHPNTLDQNTLLPLIQIKKLQRKDHSSDLRKMELDKQEGSPASFTAERLLVSTFETCRMILRMSAN